MDDALFMRRFQRLGNLLRDRQRLVDWHRTARDALRQIVALDELHHERAQAVALFETVDRGDRGWFSDARIWASRVNRARRSASLATESGRTLSATSRLSFVSRAR